MLSIFALIDIKGLKYFIGLQVQNGEDQVVSAKCLLIFDADAIYNLNIFYYIKIRYALILAR